MPKSKSKTASKKQMQFSDRLISVRDTFRGETLRFILGCLFGVIALYLILAFTSYLFTGAADQSILENPATYDLASGTVVVSNRLGYLGARVSYFFLNENFGISAYFIPVFFVFVSMKLMRAYKVRVWKWFLNFSFLMVWLSIAFSTFIPVSSCESLPFSLGGNHGDFMSHFISGLIGWVGLVLILAFAALCYLVYLSNQTIILIRRMLNPKEYIKTKFAKNKQLGEHVPEEEEVIAVKGADLPNDSESQNTHTVQLDFDVETHGDTIPQLVLEENSEEEKSVSKKSFVSQSTSDKLSNRNGRDKDNVDFTLAEREKDDKAASSSLAKEFAPYDPKLDLENYHYPTLDLLKKYGDNSPTIDMAEQTANKERIITTLRNFDVEISSIKATIGPTVTLYEITPAQGVRISKIRNLEDDIALSLSALGIRIIAPIPGKGTIGIEVPNKKPQIVSIESILNSKKFQECDYELPIALGKTITNEVFMVDLAKMPHLLVAGATGQGKSVGLNAIIASLLYKKHPAELKFVMVDPKKVEFSIYSPLEHHFLAKIPNDDDDAIITDVTKVIQTLKSLCQEMDCRYDLLKKAKVRNVKEYNEKFKSRLLSPESGHRFMPYIVVIIDEFGDLIMTAGKEVELPIARIAQLARAVGMHMVIATQRPTTNIITGTIKANFPARMAFKVMSTVDSRTILDRTGANQLIGKGDMLFLAGGDPVRVQCAFVDTPEVERINGFIAQQQAYVGAYELPEVQSDTSEGGGASADVDMNNLDPIFEEAARLIVIHQQGSTSLIQRKFSIGYNRAGRLMDQLEKAGIVGPAQGSKPRDVLCSDELELERKISTI